MSKIHDLFAKAHGDDDLTKSPTLAITLGLCGESDKARMVKEITADVLNNPKEFHNRMRDEMTTLSASMKANELMFEKLCERHIRGKIHDKIIEVRVIISDNDYNDILHYLVGLTYNHYIDDLEDYISYKENEVAEKEKEQC